MLHSLFVREKRKKYNNMEKEGFKSRKGWRRTSRAFAMCYHTAYKLCNIKENGAIKSKTVHYTHNIVLSQT